jgi:hypothetical protein
MSTRHRSALSRHAARHASNELLSYAPQLTRHWGFLAFVAVLTVSGIFSIHLARSDTGIAAVLILVVVAIVAALYARLRKVD